MSETGPGPSPEDLGLEPEMDQGDSAEASPAQEDRAAKLSELLNPSTEERDMVLRNAQSYLYEREKQSDKESTFRDTRTQRMGRAFKWYMTRSTRDFPWFEGVKKRFPQEEMDRLEHTPIDHALITAADPEKYKHFVENEMKKGEGKEDRRTLEQVAIFRKAFELRDEAARLIDEQRRGTSPERAIEIDARLNQAYLEIMLLAHTRSYQVEPVYEEKVKRGKVNRSIKQGPNETNAEWRARAQGTTTEKKLKGVEISFLNPTDPSQEGVFRRPKNEWHSQWADQVRNNEYKEGNGAGFRKPIETKGELTKETVETMRPLKDQLAAIIDDIALGGISADELERRYGLRVNVQKRDETRVFQFGKGAGNRRRATPSRELTLRLADGSFAHFGLRSVGFMKEKDGKIEITSQPPSKEQFRQDEYIRYQQTVLRPQGAESFPFPTLILTDPDAQMLQNDSAYTQLLHVLEAVARDYPNAHQEAERRRQEIAAAEQREAMENTPEAFTYQDDD